jgi:hypothetical protein
MRFVILAFVFSVVPTALAHAERAYLDGFGYSVEVPKGLAECGPDAAGHGVGFYLDGRPEAVEPGCALSKGRRVVTVFAETGRGNSIEDHAAWSCGFQHKNGTKSRPPSDLSIGGRKSTACRTNIGSKWIEILVVTECGVPPSRPHRIDMACNAWLRTTPEYFSADLNVFRATLNSVRFMAPR